MERNEITLQATGRLVPQSVTPDAFSVSWFGRETGWTVMKIGSATIDDSDRITLTVGRGMGGEMVRVIARGTGPAPILGANLVPLAGAVGGPPATADDGHDFVIMLPRSVS